MIAHLDLDCFFVSCERIKNPFLIGKPVIVGGNPKGRGVVSAASYEARRYGIRSAMPAARARALCPHAIFLKPDFTCYSEHSSKVEKYLKKMAPVLERASIDEFYLDLSGCEKIYRDWTLFGLLVKDHLKNELKLPATIAISSSKLVSKIAAGEAKPDGCRYVRVGEEAAFLAPLPIRAMPGIGKVTEQALKKMGIHTLGEVASSSREFLESSLGVWGRSFKHLAMGIDPSPVVMAEKPKSISRETTFERDEGEINYLLTLLSSFAEECCAELRHYAFKAKTVTVKFRTPDFKTFERSKTISPTSDESEVYEVLTQILKRNLTPGMKLRLIGMGVSQLIEAEDTRELFVDEERLRKEQVAKRIDQIRSRFGFEAIHFGSSLPPES